MPENEEAGAVAPVTHSFPFPVPADFAAVSNDELQALSTRVVDYSAGFAARAPHEHTEESVTALEAAAALASRINSAMSTRFARQDAAEASMSAVTALADTAAQLAAGPLDESGGEDSDGGEVVEGTVEPRAAVTAANGHRNPGVRQIGRQAQPTMLPAQMTAGSALATMSASADVQGFASGQELTSFNDAAKALMSRLDKYPTMTAGRAKVQMSRGGKQMRPITTYDPQGRALVMKSYTRHGAVQFQRHFPEELRVVDGGTNGYSVAEFAAKESRLVGGNLIESAKNRSKTRGLTAAAAWCAPSEVIYQLCELETMDGLLSVPELQTSRGGWQIPELGGPDFASIWNSIGNAGDTHLSEEDVQNDVAKICTEIPCPEFEDIRLGVDYVCLTGGLLQRRGYPEIVARFSRGAMVALAHKMNRGFIADLEAASGPAIEVPQIVNGDDAASAILAAVEMAITDIKYRNRMAFTTSLEVVMPMWFLAQIRAAISRRRGVLALQVSDAEILEWFTMRRAVPQFVYDWQDAYSDLPGGPGAADPIEALPTSGRFLVYPAGTWVKAVQDVVSLDTIYDSTNLQTNQYTAIFAEDGWAPLQMCPDSRVYEVALDPSGVVGCCPPELISF
jgi:hypothetical protein